MINHRMKHPVPLITGLVLLLAMFLPSGSYGADLTITHAPTQVYFSPGPDSTGAILKEIARARSEILLQAQSVDSTSIAKTLVDAHNRGVKVEIILGKNRKNDSCGSAAFFSGLKIPVYIDRKHAVGHSTIIIIDRTTVTAGSFNLGETAAEKTADSLAITKSKDLAKLYFDNWSKHREHAEIYKNKTKATPKGKS
ncbi:MAG: Phospholipase D precursor [Syntrophorhabdus sp. PtaU1.Bin153]|nr:MAG: Phospholipase D precursor [Syntrophorhabdus sp. PtaU1.Bin153]